MISKLKSFVSATKRIFIAFNKNLKPMMAFKNGANVEKVGSDYFLPPSHVRGMTELQPNLFNKRIGVPYIEVNEEKIENALKCVKPFLLKLRNFNSVELNENANSKLILLDPQLISSINDFNETQKNVLQEECHVTEVKYKEIELNYDNYNYETILRAVLPEDQPTVSGFSTIGHILHLNLRSHVLPYKSLVAQVLLDKLKNIKMVVNKVNNIENEFRYFEMEILGKRSQEVDTIVKIKEHGVDFEFDFSRVYWNPRLSTERQRIVKKLNKDVDVVYDVFAGVGPLSIQAAKVKRCKVIANDLNPECYKWLMHNLKLNQVEDLVSVYNMDGRDFIKDVLRTDFLKRIENIDRGLDDSCPKFHIFMNLPAVAVEFLEHFKGLLDDDNDYKPLPLVHCYCFVKGDPEDPKKVVTQMVEDVINHHIENVEIRNIRHVAPSKYMYRISFEIPQSVLYKDEASSQCKRLRTQ